MRLQCSLRAPSPVLPSPARPLTANPSPAHPIVSTSSPQPPCRTPIVPISSHTLAPCVPALSFLAPYPNGPLTPFVNSFVGFKVFYFGQVDARTYNSQQTIRVAPPNRDQNISGAAFSQDCTRIFCGGLPPPYSRRSTHSRTFMRGRAHACTPRARNTCRQRCTDCAQSTATKHNRPPYHARPPVA